MTAAFVLHHVQVSCPAGSEDVLRGFYVQVLGMVEVPKPPVLAARGGVWFRAATCEIHCGVEDPFMPARKAHPGIAVSDVDAVAAVVGASGAPVLWDENMPGVRRFHTQDPVGNRLEFQQVSAEDTSRPLSSASSMDPGAFVVTPIGFVRGARGEASDDFWGGAVSRIELDPHQFGVEAVAELDTFSHLEVVFHFHLVKEGTEERGARRPRNNPEWPPSGIFAQRAKRRPNRLGVTRCRLVKAEGLVLTVEGLDAVDGTPVVDIKPYMREFDPRGEVRQPAWSTVVMEQYFAPHDAVPQPEPHA